MTNKERNDGWFSTPPCNGALPEDAYAYDGLDANDPDFIEKFCKTNGIEFIDNTKKRNP